MVILATSFDNVVIAWHSSKQMEIGLPCHGVLCPDWIKWAGIPETLFSLVLHERADGKHWSLSKHSTTVNTVGKQNYLTLTVIKKYVTGSSFNTVHLLSLVRIMITFANDFLWQQLVVACCCKAFIFYFLFLLVFFLLLLYAVQISGQTVLYWCFGNIVLELLMSLS